MVQKRSRNEFGMTGGQMCSGGTLGPAVAYTSCWRTRPEALEKSMRPG